MTSFGDTLPPIGYVTFCRDHEAECHPSGRFADRIQLTATKFREIEEINAAVNTWVAPVTDQELYGKPRSLGLPGVLTRAIAKITCCSSAAP